MDLVKDSYNQICLEWCRYRNNNQINKCIVDFTKYLKDNSCILDIGCGSGYPISKYLCDRGFNVVGIDISDKMIEEASKLKLKNAKFILQDFLSFDSDILFDAIIAFDSLWHINLNDQEKIYSKISSLLKSGGYLIFTHGRVNGEIIGEMFNTSFYYSSLDSSYLKKILIANNFQIIDFIIDYKEPTTGERDLLVIAKKI